MKNITTALAVLTAHLKEQAKRTPNVIDIEAEIKRIKETLLPVQEVKFMSLEEHKLSISQKNFTYDMLLSYAAACVADYELLDFKVDCLERQIDAYEIVVDFQRDLLEKLKSSQMELEEIHDLQLVVSRALNRIDGLLDGKSAQSKILAKKGADALHAKPGGSRDKKDKIREIWALGKYSSRDLCAEQECAELGMSFSSARKALRGTPEPT